MPHVDLRYGRSSIPFEFAAEQFTVLGAPAEKAGLSDAELGERFDRPIGSESLESIISAGQSVLIVVPDATRQTACGQVVNLLVRRLIANGVNAFDIRIIFATGIHRKVTDEEKAAILTPFIAQRIKTLDHDPRDLMQLVRLGETPDGIGADLNRALVEQDHVILVGGVTFHYFAGFTGGRKLVCPGLASAATISATHKLAFDCEQKKRRDGVGTGLLDGNPVHEAFISVVQKVNPAFAISTMVNDAGEAIELYCGDWIMSHRAACETFAAEHTIDVPETRDLVIASCGGYPHDINMIQAHKALDAASKVCSEDGTIILLAECPDGTGRSDFLDWFSATDSSDLADRLCKSYQVNGQTAWSLLTKTERFSVQIVTQIPRPAVERMRLRPSDSLEDAMRKAARWTSGYIIPNGAKTNIRVV